MKKRLIHILLFLVLIISSISVSFASFSQLSNEKDFVSTGTKDDSSTYICYNKETQTKYTSLHTALNQASSGQSIYIVPGSTININDSIIVRSGISLYIPYDGENWDIVTDSQITSTTFIDNNASGVNNNRKSQLIFNDGADITIENGGKLYLGGIFGSRGISASYCEITLGENSSISCYGEFYCYGYVKEGISINSGINSNQVGNTNFYENEFDLNRFLRLYTGSYLKTAIAIHDAGSTGQMSSYNSSGVCPLNIIEFPNIQTFTRVDFGSSFNVQLRLALGSGSDINYTNQETCIINSNSNSQALFILQSGWLGIEYCPNNTSYTTYSSTINSSPTKIFVHGTTYLGELEFAIKIVMTITIRTSEMFLPISHKFMIYICDGGIFNAENDIKFMPGSFLQVNEGGIFNSNADLMIYSSTKFSEVDSSTYPSTCRTKDAVFLVNGTLNISESSTIGGFITNSITNANATINLLQVQQSNLRVSLPEGVNGIELSSYLTGPFYDEITGNITTYQFKGLTSVHSYQNFDNLSCWYGDKYSVFNLNIIVNQKYTNNFVEYRVYQADDNLGNNQIELTSSVFNDSYNFEIASGKYYKVVVSGNEESVYFSSLPNGSNYNFNSNTWYLINGNTEITIIPGEGLVLQVYVQGISGAGSSKVNVLTSKTDSSYTDFTTYSPSGNDVLLKNTWVQLKFTGGINSSFKQVEVKATYRKSITSPIGCSTTEPVNGQDGFTEINIDDTFCLTESTLIYIAIQEAGMCLMSDSKILMADGSYKLARDLCKGDILLTYNHLLGKFEGQKILANIIYKNTLQDVITLTFSNGNILKVATGHGLFNINRNRYEIYYGSEFLRHIGEKYISVKMNEFNNFNFEIVTLTNVKIEKKVIDKYSPVSEYNINCISDNMLTIPDDIEGMFNAYEYGDINNGFKINYDKFLQYVGIYGIYEYEDVEKVLPKYLYDVLNFKYFKTFIGMGVITYEKTNYLIQKYAKQFTEYQGIEWDWNESELLTELN